MRQTRTQSKATSAESLSRFATRMQRALGIKGDVNICITSNREIQSLNWRFRRKNRPTDVLTFPSAVPYVAGDIAISLEIAAANADQLGHSMDTEVKILILHGMLHLAGYDHEIDDGEMEAKEAALRMQLKLPVGLIQRSQESAGGTRKNRERRS
ncbi:MAG TPA: rRNA maturation RNase YbeY [Candidatus Binatia bacterium]|nr:rRNA maturation RNase YbeY [Candidatus Binatia bacterium]